MRSRLVWWIAPVCSTLAAAYFLFGPSYGTASSTVTSAGGTAVVVSGHASGLSANGAWAFVPMSIPIIMTLVPLSMRDARAMRAAGFLMSVLLFLLCLISFGWLFMPSAIALTVAAVRTSVTGQG